MDEELLSDILAVEREIRQRNSTLEQESAAWLAALAVELEEALRQEAARLDEALAGELVCAEQTARGESNSLLAEANLYAARIASLGEGELDSVINRYLVRLYREQGHDRQDEQA